MEENNQNGISSAEMYQLEIAELTKEKYTLLKRIKEYNKGIQVIIFSATNKIWNLQALQEAGADGFILKESPENNFDFDFTKQSVLNMIDKTSECLGMIFLKDINNIIKRIKINVLML